MPINDGLKKYREDIASGKRKPAKRKSAEEFLAIKKAKLNKLLEQVEVLKNEVATLDARINKKKIAEFLKGKTYEEIQRAFGVNV